MHKRWAGILGLLMLAACHTAGEPQSKPRGGVEHEWALRPLRDDEIAAAVEGHSIVIARVEEAGAPSITETFCRGRVTILGTRAPMYGAYEIRGGALCTQFQSAPATCSTFYRAANGALFRIPRESGTGPLRPLDVVEASCE